MTPQAKLKAAEKVAAQLKRAALRKQKAYEAAADKCDEALTVAWAANDDYETAMMFVEMAQKDVEMAELKAVADASTKAVNHTPAPPKKRPFQVDKV